MKLTSIEVKNIANRLHDVVAAYFYDAVQNAILDREGSAEVEITDEDVLMIKKQLKRIL